MVSKRKSGFGEGGTAGVSRQELDAELRFETEQSSTHDGLGDAEPAGGGRNAASVSNFYKCPQLFDIQFGVPNQATQRGTKRDYRGREVNGKVRFPPAAPQSAPRSRKPTSASMDVVMTFRNGLASLLRPEDSVLVLIDHQPYQLANLNSHDPHMVVNNSTALAKAARAFGVPTILTSVIAERGGLIFPQITEVFPGQQVIDRTFINTWEDRKVVDAVKATGRKQLIIAGLWTEICVAMPVIQALGEGWDVTVITDASGATSVEAHEVAIQRMIAAGANMMTWLALAAEWQRDWARTDHAAELTEVLKQHAAGSGIAYLWEQQLLNTPAPGASR
nr:hydrolase [Peristeroidobacter soli]